MAKPRVLYDLSLGLSSMGFSGIPQDTRLLFAGLARSGAIEIEGLVRPNNQSLFTRANLGLIEEQAVFIGPFLDGMINNRSAISRVLHRVRPVLGTGWQNLIGSYRVTPSLFEVPPSLNDAIFRRVFASTVKPEDRAILHRNRYHLSRLGNDRIMMAVFGFLPRPRIDTTGFDFLLTQDTKPIRVSRGTQVVVRYHDGIPVLGADTFGRASTTRLHARAVRQVADTAYFVCNSDSAREDLRSLDKRAAERAVVIPYFIPEMSKVPIDPETLASITTRRASHATGAPTKTKVQSPLSKTKTPKYIMSLATLEPRKNYNRLIEAWQLLRMKAKEDIKLLIVGTPGWLEGPILHTMRPFVEDGSLIHLEKVSQSELPYLYSGASAFCFISVAEGFGLPPTEAMQCDCPVVLSDISAHRYMAGDAAAYVDPYDVRGISEALYSVLSDDQLRKDLIQKGRSNIKRYSREAVTPLWETFFDTRLQSADAAS